MRRDKCFELIGVHPRRVAAVAFAAIVLIAPASVGQVHPANTLDSPAEAYARGRELAQSSKEKAVEADAAHYFARAYHLKPNETALRQALRSATRGDMAELGMALVDIVEQLSGASSETRAEGDNAKSTFDARVGKFAVSCSCDCRVTVNGSSLEPLHGGYLAVGRHDLQIQRGSKNEQRRIEILSGRVLNFDAEHLCAPPVTHVAATSGHARSRARRAGHPRPPTGPRSTSSLNDSGEPEGLSPVWFWAGVAVTGVLGGASTWSALDTRKLHGEFDESPTDDLRARGESAQFRTNALLGVTAAAAIGTAILAFSAVNWQGRTSSASLGMSPAGVSLSGRF